MTDSDPILVDIGAAALFADVATSTVRWWIKRGRLTRRGTDERRRTLVDLRDVDRIAPKQPTTDAA